MADATENSVRPREQANKPDVAIPLPDNREKLKKNITVTRGIALMVGAMSGSAIFITPSIVTKASNAPAPSILMWLVGGVVAMCAGLVFCELGTMFPVSGSDVVYLKRIYGPLGGFLSVWMIKFLLAGMTQAIVMLTFSEYFWAIFYKSPEVEVNWWLLKAVPILLFFVIVALASTKPDLMLTSVVFFTTLQVTSMMLVIVAGLVSLANGNTTNLSIGFEGTNMDLTDWGMAWNGVIYAFLYWEYICSVTSEVQNPEKNVPIIVVSSITIVTTLYVLTVISLHIVIPVTAMKQDVAVAVSFGFETMGDAGKIIIGSAIALSSLGGSQSTFIAVSRYIHSGSVEGLLPSCFGLVSRRFKTPLVSILYVAAGTTIFIVIGGIEDLISWATFMEFPFHVACPVGVFILRKRNPEINHPCKVPLIFPALFVIFGIYLFMNSFLSTDWPASLIWVSVLLLGVPIYFLMLKNVFHIKILQKLDKMATAFLARVLDSE